MRILRNWIILLALAWGAAAQAATYLEVRTTVGNMTLELFDQEKPITVNNFLRYVRDGKWTNQFIQRWETNFVIQGGGWTLNRATQQPIQVSTYGSIQNEFSPAAKYSNKYGTIAMARQGGVTNSASSQWFFNVNDNSFLDNVDGGFTVFGRLISGFEVLNLFKGAKGTQNPPLYTASYQASLTGLSVMPVTKNAGATFNDVVFIDFVESPKPTIKVSLTRASRQISFPSMGGVTYILESSLQLPPVWTTVGIVVGSGGTATITDNTPFTSAHFYRVRYN